MCDRIPLLENCIRIIESDVGRLTRLLKRCKESTKMVYKCYLISDQINEKQQSVEFLKESLQENIQLCNMYQQLDKEANPKNRVEN